MNLASDVYLITVTVLISGDGELVCQPASCPMPLTVTTVCILFSWELLELAAARYIGSQSIFN